MHYFLGIGVHYISSGIVLSQRKFTQDLLSDFDMLHCKPANTLLPQHLRRTLDLGDLLPNSSTYRAILGKLKFLTHTRPDLCFVVQTLSQFMQAPPISHMEALFHVLRYVKATASQGILMNGFESTITQCLFGLGLGHMSNDS